MNENHTHSGQLNPGECLTVGNPEPKFDSHSVSVSVTHRPVPQSATE